MFVLCSIHVAREYSVSSKPNPIAVSLMQVLSLKGLVLDSEHSEDANRFAVHAARVQRACSLTSAIMDAVTQATRRWLSAGEPHIKDDVEHGRPTECRTRAHLSCRLPAAATALRAVSKTLASSWRKGSPKGRESLQ